MRPEPHIYNAITAHPRVNPTGHGFHFGQFGHRSIIEEPCTACVPASNRVRPPAEQDTNPQSGTGALLKLDGGMDFLEESMKF
jgi:hypothetical protein